MESGEFAKSIWPASKVGCAMCGFLFKAIITFDCVVVEFGPSFGIS